MTMNALIPPTISAHFSQPSNTASQTGRQAWNRLSVRISTRWDRSGPPHVHVRREKMVAKFWLEPVARERAGGFSRVELNAIARLVQEHRERLLESWHEFFGS